MRRPIILEPGLGCPNNVNGITLDPKPNWTFNDLLSELNSLQLNLDASSTAPIFAKMQPREFPSKKGASNTSNAFVMSVSDDDGEDIHSDDGENHHPNLAVGTRFSCKDSYVSDTDSSEAELALGDTRAPLMDQVSLSEALLTERELEHQQFIEEEIRHQIALLEMDLMTENERSTSALIQLEKLTDARREMDRKLDTQYRRKTAEALDNHLIAVQRNHEHKSQIEERKIRNDAAFEEAKRKERARQEEKVSQEKAKAEAEAAERRAEEAKKEALEAEIRMAKEVEELKASEKTKVVLGQEAQTTTRSKMNSTAEVSPELKGNMVRATERALKLEAERRQKYDEITEKNQILRQNSNKDFSQYEMQIGRHIKQIAGTKENFRTKSSKLIDIINSPLCPQSISIAMFAKKVVSRFDGLNANFDSTAFACGHVIVQVTSMVPLAMDIVLAEFHSTCIYTVPKHIVKLESGLNEESYLKVLGFREEDGKLETTEQYLGRLERCMKLYGALVQTEIDGVRNLHGIREGWAWLARLLNALPANIYTAVALEAFLKMAGYTLFRKYKSQFRKILNLISANFASALEKRGDQKLTPVLTKIKEYINSNQYLKEPEGWRMQKNLLSSEIGASDTDSGYQQNEYYHQQSNYYHQQNQYIRQPSHW